MTLRDSRRSCEAGDSSRPGRKYPSKLSGHAPADAWCDADQALSIPEFGALMQRLGALAQAMGRTLPGPRETTRNEPALAHYHKSIRRALGLAVDEGPLRAAAE